MAHITCRLWSDFKSAGWEHLRHLSWLCTHSALWADSRKIYFSWRTRVEDMKLRSGIQLPFIMPISMEFIPSHKVGGKIKSCHLNSEHSALPRKEDHVCGEPYMTDTRTNASLLGRCYRIRSKYGDKIGSAFPVVSHLFCASL